MLPSPIDSPSLSCLETVHWLSFGYATTLIKYLLTHHPTSCLASLIHSPLDSKWGLPKAKVIVFFHRQNPLGSPCCPQDTYFNLIYSIYDHYALSSSHTHCSQFYTILLEVLLIPTSFLWSFCILHFCLGTYMDCSLLLCPSDFQGGFFWDIFPDLLKYVLPCVLIAATNFTSHR